MSEAVAEKAPPSPKVGALVNGIKNLSVMELVELKSALETEFGVTAAVAMPMMGMGMGAGAPAAAVEQTEFDVILKEAGANKIPVIKVVRSITSLGLKEAKDLVEGAPKAVKTGVSKDEAKKIKEELAAAGATVEIK